MKTLAAAVIALLLSGAPVQAAVSCADLDKPASEAGARGVEDLWLAMLTEKSGVVAECLLAPEFTDITWRGTVVTKAQAVANIAHRPTVNSRFGDMSVRLYGNVAVVHGLNIVNRGTGPAIRIRFIDVLVYGAKGWRAVSSQETLQP